MSNPQKQSVRAEIHIQRHVPEDGGLGSGQEKVEGGLSGQPAAPLEKKGLNCEFCHLLSLHLHDEGPYLDLKHLSEE